MLGECLFLSSGSKEEEFDSNDARSLGAFCSRSVSCFTRVSFYFLCWVVDSFSSRKLMKRGREQERVISTGQQVFMLLA